MRSQREPRRPARHADRRSAPPPALPAAPCCRPGRPAWQGEQVGGGSSTHRRHELDTGGLSRSRHVKGSRYSCAPGLGRPPRAAPVFTAARRPRRTFDTAEGSTFQRWLPAEGVPAAAAAGALPAGAAAAAEAAETALSSERSAAEGGGGLGRRRVTRSADGCLNARRGQGEGVRKQLAPRRAAARTARHCRSAKPTHASLTCHRPPALAGLVRKHAVPPQRRLAGIAGQQAATGVAAHSRRMVECGWDC